MAGGRWKQALEAVQSIAPHTCDCDADGISLYFFNNRFEKMDNVRTSEEVMQHFAARSPGGGTKLAGVLEDAVKPDGVDLSGKRRPETLLVISDGEPSDRDEVERVIINATKQYMTCDEDLSITFIQVGNDKDAEKWLGTLDDDLQSKGAQPVLVYACFISRLRVSRLARLFPPFFFIFSLFVFLFISIAGARFDCVDVMTFSDFQGTSFPELIRLSLVD